MAVESTALSSRAPEEQRVVPVRGPGPVVGDCLKYRLLQKVRKLSAFEIRNTTAPIAETPGSDVQPAQTRARGGSRFRVGRARTIMATQEVCVLTPITLRIRSRCPVSSGFTNNIGLSGGSRCICTWGSLARFFRGSA